MKFEAEYYYLLAAKNGDCMAECSLALLYQEQDNFERAKYWADHAIAQNFFCLDDLKSRKFDFSMQTIAS